VPALFARLHALCCLMAGGLALLAFGTSEAQQGTRVFQYRWNSAPKAEDITPPDIRDALMWTGHLDSVFKGELAAAVRKASQAWQKSKGHTPTETLPTEQIIELVTQGLKERDEVGWSILHDNAVGIALGIPPSW
jgi:hypothetical protein